MTIEVPSEWLDEVAEYLSEREDCDEGQPNQAMSLLTRMMAFHAWPPCTCEEWMEHIERNCSDPPDPLSDEVEYLSEAHAEHPTGGFCIWCREQWPCEESHE